MKDSFGMVSSIEMLDLTALLWYIYIISFYKTSFCISKRQELHEKSSVFHDFGNRA